MSMMRRLTGGGRWAALTVAVLLGLGLWAPAPAQAACTPCPAGTDTEACVWACCLEMSCTLVVNPGCIAFCAAGKILADVLGDERALGLAFDNGAPPYDPTCAQDPRFGVIDLPAGRGGGERVELRVVPWSFGDGGLTIQHTWDCPSCVLSLSYRRLADFVADPRGDGLPIGKAVFGEVDPGAYVARWDLAGVPPGEHYVVIGTLGRHEASRNVRPAGKLRRVFGVALSPGGP